jgi:hypothetical protein
MKYFIILAIFAYGCKRCQTCTVKLIVNNKVHREFTNEYCGENLRELKKIKRDLPEQKDSVYQTIECD